MSNCHESDTDLSNEDGLLNIIISLKIRIIELEKYVENQDLINNKLYTEINDLSLLIRNFLDDKEISGKF